MQQARGQKEQISESFTESQITYMLYETKGWLFSNSIYTLRLGFYFCSQKVETKFIFLTSRVILNEIYTNIYLII